MREYDEILHHFFGVIQKENPDLISGSDDKQTMDCHTHFTEWQRGELGQQI
jgi:hypothetical protein